MRTQQDTTEYLDHICTNPDMCQLHKKIDHVKYGATRKKLHIELNVGINMTSLLNYMLRICQKHNIPTHLFGTRDPSKEITEVGAAIYHAMRFEYLGNVRCYIIGEGKRPVVSYILSRITNWNIVTIDPILEPPIDPLTNVTICSKLDTEVDISDHDQYDSVVIIGVHSHNQMDVFWKKIIKPKILIWIPCCQEISIPDPFFYRETQSILSPKNKVWIWKKGDFVEKHGNSIL